MLTLNPTEPTDRPIYWFATLDMALERGDLETAARAVQELHRRGIDVRVNTSPYGRLPELPVLCGPEL